MPQLWEIKFCNFDDAINGQQISILLLQKSTNIVAWTKKLWPWLENYFGSS